jgi:hypothetical protein
VCFSILCTGAGLSSDSRATEALQGEQCFPPRQPWLIQLSKMADCSYRQSLPSNTVGCFRAAPAPKLLRTSSTKQPTVSGNFIPRALSVPQVASASRKNLNLSLRGRTFSVLIPLLFTIPQPYWDKVAANIFAHVISGPLRVPFYFFQQLTTLY